MNRKDLLQANVYVIFHENMGDAFRKNQRYLLTLKHNAAPDHSRIPDLYSQTMRTAKEAELTR
jgi:hypothetical protein